MEKNKNNTCCSKIMSLINLSIQDSPKNIINNKLYKNLNMCVSLKHRGPRYNSNCVQYENFVISLYSKNNL